MTKSYEVTDKQYAELEKTGSIIHALGKGVYNELYEATVSENSDEECDYTIVDNECHTLVDWD